MTITTPVKAILASNKHFLDRQDAMESNVRSYPRKLPFAYEKAEGCWVTDVEGNKYLDFLAGAGTLALGHNHPVLMQAIRDVLLFPTMKSQGSAKNEANNVAQTAAAAPAETAKVDFSNVKVEPLFEEEVDFDTFSKSDFRAVKVKECVAVPKSKKLLQFTLDDGTGTDRTILSGIHSYYEPEELVGKTLIAITNLPPRKMMGIESCGMLLSAVNNLKDSEDEELHLLMVDNHIPAGAKLY